MKKILWLLIFLSGCASKQLRVIPSPTLTELQSNLSNPSKLSENIEIGRKFLAAEADLLANKPEEACKTYMSLSEIDLNPIKDAATIKLIENCELSTRKLKSIWESFTPQNYAKETYYEKSLSLAISNKLELFEAQFSYELTPFKKAASEKVRLLSRALQIAKDLGKSELEKKVFEKLKMISPRFETNITNENKLSIAKDFESARNFDIARKMYEEIINSSDEKIEIKVKAMNANRMSYKVERNLKAFLERTYDMEKILHNELDKNPTDLKLSTIWGESVINLARAVWTEHRANEAQTILENFLSSNYGSENHKGNAELIIGLIQIEDKKNTEALLHFKKAIKYNITESTLKENIQWALVWNSYILNQHEEVIKYANKFGKPSLNPFFFNKLYYWKGKSQQKQKKNNEANETFQNLSKNDPFGYYGIISTIELGLPFSPIESSTISNVESAQPILDWLLVLNQTRLAQNYLKEIDSTFKTIREREKAMGLYLQTEWYQGGMRQLTNFPLKNRNEITNKYISVLFPEPNKKIVDEASEKFHVPTALILGITRQESSFIPTERSWADAFGLMQMIPERAKTLSKKYNIPYAEITDLYKPEINIQMGTALLSELIKQYDGKFAQTVAAYNASPEAIKTWERDRFNGNYIEFIEMIPYEETRNYIKLVFRNYIVYKKIISKEEFKLDSNFFAKPFSY